LSPPEKGRGDCSRPPHWKKKRKEGHPCALLYVKEKKESLPSSQEKGKRIGLTSSEKGGVPIFSLLKGGKEEKDLPFFISEKEKMVLIFIPLLRGREGRCFS